MLCLLCPQILSILIVVVSYFVFAIVHTSYATARLEDSMGQGQYQASGKDIKTFSWDI